MDNPVGIASTTGDLVYAVGDEYMSRLAGACILGIYKKKGRGDSRGRERTRRQYRRKRRISNK